ncbi:alcohol dehydrogenase catalytic domain-containing protein [Petroclostridium sp. X23]|uniref:zinc-dependent alcohol dehydrogenase n=1 Tax=Petroclostridium sp. X23 TaxID=3045146 RepID=UPI0024AD82FC|nr:alcohol dehydrogenase catalytic domain-containing protein [Petroclostridium sp. X23]WHH58195.1 alcohol dehydrogenase catalytic domain-containing protein [Petroclostridium sp. X23]
MKAVIFNASIPKYITTMALGSIHKDFYHSPMSCITYKEVNAPSLPNDHWVKIRTLYGGICGSDLNMILLHDSPSTSPFVSFPFVIGHENLGIIVEKGKDVQGFDIGDKVVADPLLSCDTREVSEHCTNCRTGHYSLCENITKPPISPGISIGFCKDTGGSWGEYYVAHQSHLYKVPDHITDKEAVMVDPICSALHPVMNNFPGNNEKILVVGSGVIGLLVIACIRALGSKCDITIMAKHAFQGKLAKNLGANRIIYTRNQDYFDEFKNITNASLYQPMLGKRFMMGGFDKVFDCVGSSSSIDESLKFTRARGTMILVGLASYPKKVDWTPVWFKELKLTGSMYYNTETFQDGKTKTAYRIALDLLADKKLDIENMVTHTFDIENYRQGIKTALDKRNCESLKVVFKF